MLEESNMDKKSNNRQTSQPRASAVDCKKVLESTFKPAPRYNKKREGNNNAPKNDPYRKNTPAQRGRGPPDRRPRPRGSAGIVLGGMENSRISEDEPELGSLFVPGSKKQNFNHLLNFIYTPRGPPASERRGAVPRHNGVQRVSHSHNQNLYLQACCQFVVKEDGDYRENFLDPDIPVKWDQIEEIIVRSTGASECPICLGAPAAGRVGRCGHVFCWPCALHYAAAHDRQPPPCPVCAAPFRVGTMKPARIVQWQTSSEEVTMRLVRRLRGSTTVEVAPTRGQAAAYDGLLPLSALPTAPYGKLFAASANQTKAILERERKELQDQILAEIDTTEIVFIEQALKTLEMQEQVLSGSDGCAPKVMRDENEDKDDAPTIFETNNNGTNNAKIDWFDEEEGAACMEIEKLKQNELTNLQKPMTDLSISEPDFSIPEQSSLNPEAPEFDFSLGNDVTEFPLVEDDTTTLSNEESVNNVQASLTEEYKDMQSKYFYFYQVEDGQQIFLNSLNVRILVASWGALVAAPSVIRGRVLTRESISLDELTRKHVPFAAHLPLHCPMDIVELDLRPPYVTQAALTSYSEELDRRARMRARSEREERRRERAYRRATEAPPRPDFSSDVLFPPTSPPRYTADPPLSQSGAVMHADAAASPPGPSFAKMAGTGGTWRVRAPAAARAASPPPDEEGAPPRALSLSDAIEAALHAAPANKNKKNKKNKPKLLFAMGMQHASPN